VLKLEQTIDTLSIRLDKLERDNCELFNRTNTTAITLATVNEKLNSMLITLGELKSGMERLQQQPAKRWESILGALLSAIVATCVGFIAAKVLR
jgi:hypothetical protein